ncbi:MULTISPECIES: DotG/IcmE/VirB10 family protein [Cysteiniphilum]|uniref:DotG/IcmE/VirB10 family protein n=1 Tax=Cysteiniphilum TaxID=2056696 RepID=UPI0017830D92|nr:MULTISPECIES: DotG/IcmE/VirB10 family protein [Cysteiniphilum]
MLRFLKNHPRLRVLLIIITVFVISIIMLISCGKSRQTYLTSSIHLNKEEDYQVSGVEDVARKKLIEHHKETHYKNATENHASYIEGVFSGGKRQAGRQENKPEPIDNDGRMEPVEFYKQKAREKKSLKGGDVQDSVYGNSMTKAQLESQQKNFEMILKSWNKRPMMSKNNAVVERNQSELTNGLSALDKLKKRLFKAGDIQIAVIDTAVNSDQEGTPVLARIVVGPYKGAKLLGGFVRKEDKLVIQFNTLSIANRPTSIEINAYAIDQSTAQTALASDVDHHYLLRYGSLFAASFLDGFGNYFTNSQMNNQRMCYWDSTSNKTVCIGNEADLTAKNAAYAGVGKIGSALSKSVAKEFDRPPTVTIDQGSAIGVLFMRDVSE